MNDWQKVFSADNQVRANIVKDILAENGLNPIIVNKKDSSYNAFGTFEILVSRDEIMKAMKIIEDDIRFE